MDSHKKIAFAGISTALAVGLGYSLAAIPNIELVTLTVAFSSYILASWIGPLIGAISFFLYSVLNPYGVPPPPILLAQVIGGILAGTGGTLFFSIKKKIDTRIFRIIISAALGFSITLIFDLLTNLGAYISAGSQETLWVFLIGGLSFSVMHIVSNTLLFGAILPLLIKFKLKDKLI